MAMSLRNSVRHDPTHFSPLRNCLRPRRPPSLAHPMNTARCLAIALLTLTPLFAAQTPPPSAAKATPADIAARPKVGTTIYNWDKLAVRPSAVGVRRDIAENPTATLEVFEAHISTLNVGNASHPPHQHPQEEIIIVKEGQLEVHINGKTTPAGPGSVLFYATNDMHNVRNIGTTPATYWVVNLATEATHHPELHRKDPTIHSQVVTWEKMTETPTPLGFRRNVHNGSTVTMKSLTVHVTSIKGGATNHEPHRHPDEELVILKEGTLDINLDGRKERVGPGSMFFFGSNDRHNMTNPGTTPATFYVIRMITAATPAAVAQK
jgi:quercetin dioxygenase-like cupin family protein